MIIEEYGTKPIWERSDNSSQVSYGITTVANGYTNSFVMNWQQLRQLALKSSFEASLQTKIFGNPSSVIQSILIFPYNIDVTSAQQANLYLGGYSTGISCYEYATRRYIKLDMGRIKIDGEDFTDYTGYCSAQIYFPYLGFIDVNINDIIDREIQFWLYLDIKTGNGIYTVGTFDDYKDGTEVYRVISTHSTKIAVEIPAGYSNAGEKALEATLKTIKLAANVATSYTGTPPTTTTTTTTKSTTTHTTRNPDTGRQRTAQRWKNDTTKTSTSQTNRDKSEIVVDAFNNSITSIANSQISTYSDRLNGTENLGFLANVIQVIIRKPKMLDMGNDYNHLFGRPLGQTRRLGDMSGFTVVTNVHLDGFDGVTSTELDLIDSVLKEGIII